MALNLKEFEGTVAAHGGYSVIGENVRYQTIDIVDDDGTEYRLRNANASSPMTHLIVPRARVKLTLYGKDRILIVESQDRIEVNPGMNIFELIVLHGYLIFGFTIAYGLFFALGLWYPLYKYLGPLGWIIVPAIFIFFMGKWIMTDFAARQWALDKFRSSTLAKTVTI